MECDKPVYVIHTYVSSLTRRGVSIHHLRALMHGTSVDDTAVSFSLAPLLSFFFPKNLAINHGVNRSNPSMRYLPDQVYLSIRWINERQLYQR